MNIITDGRHRFEVVDCIPKGYEIWNIGEHMIPGYLPFCRLAAVQPFPGGRNIEVETLKAMRTDGYLEIMDTAMYGFETLASMERYLEKHPNPKKNTRPYFKVQRIKAALPWMKELEERSAGKEQNT